ncbi:MAG: hypothetical protein ACLPSW_35990 [Roseiarcus sp.]
MLDPKTPQRAIRRALDADNCIEIGGGGVLERDGAGFLGQNLQFSRGDYFGLPANIVRIPQRRRIGAR